MIQDHERIAIFQAQTRNVRELKVAWGHVNRQINGSLLQKNEKAVEVNTKILALIYCALAEAIFSKLLHTPHGLTLDEIEQIKKLATSNGVKDGWLKCAELAVRNVEGTKSNHKPNVLKRLASLIKSSIYDPSIIRNKLAHGQWCIALNRENTAVNEDITREIDSCTIIELYRRKESLERLAAIIEDMIESPNKAHIRDYWTHLSELETRTREISTWTIAGKKKQLNEKKARASATVRETK